MTRSDVSDVSSLGFAPDPDERVLRDTIIKALRESPKAFLAVADEMAEKRPAFWSERLTSASWAVIQRGSETLGIAAAKPPDPRYDNAHPDRARFIESVWIHPDLRMHGVGQRLVTYLIEQQRLAGRIDFYLWVLDRNTPAISFYEQLNFKRTGRHSRLPETQFCRKYDNGAITREEVQRNLDERANDLRDFGITYRMLNGDSAESHPPSWSEPPGR